MRKQLAARAFTLVETLVAVSLLTIAIVAPMSLTTQSLSAAYYSRDQITASFLAQEALEAVRSVRDDNVLATSYGTPTDLMANIPSISSAPFTADAHNLATPLALCNGTCPLLQTDTTQGIQGNPGTGELYGYSAGWTNTNFTRYVTACYVQSSDGSCNGTVSDEVRMTATVTWQTGTYQRKTISLSENLYRWINDGT